MVKSHGLMEKRSRDVEMPALDWDGHSKISDNSEVNLTEKQYILTNIIAK